MARCTARRMLIIAISTVALMASACSTDGGTVTLDSAADSIDESAASTGSAARNDVSDSTEPDSAERSEPADPQPNNTAGAPAEGAYIDKDGPLLVRQRIDGSVSATGQTFEFTEIHGEPVPGAGVAEFIYRGARVDGELLESSYQRNPTISPAEFNDFTICSARIDGCVRSFDDLLGSQTYGTWFRNVADYRYLDMWPGPIEIINDAAWDKDSTTTSVGGQPGVCFTATGEAASSGVSYPAGDRVCGFFVTNDGQHTEWDIEFVAYDQGGDGTFEIEALKVTSNWTDADIVLLGSGIDTEPDNDAMTAFIADGDF